MTQPIVALYDGSKFSKRAFPWAVEIARRTARPLRLVRAHTFGVPGEKPMTKPHQERGALIYQARSELEKLAKRLRTPELPIEAVLLEHGPPITQLIDYMQANDPAWVVMATHGRSGFSRFWLGSTAMSLIRELTVPIFLLPGKSKLNEPSITHIAAAVDGSAHSEAILPPVTDLARSFNAAVTVVELISAYELEETIEATPQSEAPFDPEAVVETFVHAKLAKQVQRLAAEGIAAGSLVRPISEPVAPALLKAAGDLQAEVLALSTQGRGFWSAAALGSVADKVLRTANMPLVIYHPAVAPQ